MERLEKNQNRNSKKNWVKNTIKKQYGKVKEEKNYKEKKIQEIKNK